MSLLAVLGVGVAMVEGFDWTFGLYKVRLFSQHVLIPYVVSVEAISWVC